MKGSVKSGEFGIPGMESGSGESEVRRVESSMKSEKCGVPGKASEV